MVSFVGDDEVFVRRLEQSFSLNKLCMDGCTLNKLCMDGCTLNKLCMDGCTPYGARLEKQYIGDERNRTRRYDHNTIECELKPFRVTKIYHSSSTDRVVYNASN